MGGIKIKKKKRRAGCWITIRERSHIEFFHHKSFVFLSVDRNLRQDSKDKNSERGGNKGQSPTQLAMEGGETEFIMERLKIDEGGAKKE